MWRSRIELIERWTDAMSISCKDETCQRVKEKLQDVEMRRRLEVKRGGFSGLEVGTSSYSF